MYLQFKPHTALPYYCDVIVQLCYVGAHMTYYTRVQIHIMMFWDRRPFFFFFSPYKRCNRTRHFFFFPREAYYVYTSGMYGRHRRRVHAIQRVRTVNVRCSGHGKVLTVLSRYERFLSLEQKKKKKPHNLRLIIFRSHSRPLVLRGRFVLNNHYYYYYCDRDVSGSCGRTRRRRLTNEKNSSTKPFRT